MNLSLKYHIFCWMSCIGASFDSKQKGHNPIYIIATLLDPRYKMLLDSEHVAYARKECLKCLNGDIESSDEDGANGHGVSAVLQSPGASDGNTSMIEPPHKRPRKESSQFLYIDRVLQQKATEKKQLKGIRSYQRYSWMDI